MRITEKTNAIVVAGAIIASVGAVLALLMGHTVAAAVLVAAVPICVCLALLCMKTRVAINIAELKSSHREAETAYQLKLRRMQASTQTIIDSVPHGVAMVSTDGVIELANTHGALFGMERGKRVAELPHTWIKPLADEAARRREPVGLSSIADLANQEGLVQMFEGGRELFYRPRAAPLIDEQGNLAGVTVVLVDVTGARQVDEAKSSLISSFSHELKTPMTSIQMSIYLLLEDAAPRLTPRQLELLQVARDDADRLHRLVEQILEGARSKW